MLPDVRIRDVATGKKLGQDDELRALSDSRFDERQRVGVIRRYLTWLGFHLDDGNVDCTSCLLVVVHRITLLY